MDAVGLELLSENFIRNQFKGRPASILFEPNLLIELPWFGYREQDDVMEIVDSFLIKLKVISNWVALFGFG